MARQKETLDWLVLELCCELMMEVWYAFYFWGVCIVLEAERKLSYLAFPVDR